MCRMPVLAVSNKYLFSHTPAEFILWPNSWQFGLISSKFLFMQRRSYVQKSMMFRLPFSQQIPSNLPKPSLWMARKFSVPKVDGPVTKTAKPESSWMTFMKSHSEEFLNILLASILLIVTLRMLREKGEKLEEKKAVELEIECLKKELSRMKGEIFNFIESDLTKIVVSSIPKGAKADLISSQVSDRIRSIVSPTPVTTVQPPEEPPSTMQSTVQKGLI